MRKIKLAMDHTHAGEKYYAGNDVELPDDVAERVIRLTGATRASAVDAAAGPVNDAPAAEPNVISAEPMDSEEGE